MAHINQVTKNTILLYIRMIFTVCINLYASRIILETLGVDDFGIYNIVGGIVLLLGFLNTSMAGCTARFLTYELGRNDTDMLNRTFAGALQIHIFIAAIVLILGETVGLWFVNTHINITESRYVAANFVYQFSLLSAVISFVQVPYRADLIARERLDIYAYVEIVNVILRLLAIYIVSYLSFDRLISYSGFITVVTFVVFLIYFFYSRSKFKEATSWTRMDKSIIVPMLKFSGWDLYGNASVAIQQQGINLLLNRSFGAVLNAASGVATQASSAVSTFVSSFTMALRPPIIKRYASGDIQGLQKMLILAVVVCAFLAELICAPLYFRIDSLMAIWLKEVPPHAVEFCKWMLLANSIGVLNTLFTTLIHATGNIKRLSLISGTMYLSTVIFSYIALQYYDTPAITYMILFIVTILVLLINILIARKQIPQLSYSKIITELIRPLFSIVFIILVTSYMNGILPDNLYGTVLLFIINAVIALSVLYFIWVGPKYGWDIRNLFKANEV